MKLFTGGIVTETTPFSPFPTGLADFEPAGKDAKLLGGLIERVLDVFRGRAAALGFDVVTGRSAGAMPGGLVTREAHETLKARLVEDLERALPVDLVVLFLHGAMMARGYDDCEGDLLRAVRERVGSGVPIGVEIDPHANLSSAMVEHSDLLVAFKEWPHVDIMERAAEVFDLTVRVAERRIEPVTSVYDCRMIGIYHTMEQPMKGLLDEIRALEGRDGVISISIIHGYPFADSPDMGTKMLVITDRDRAKGARLAEHLGRELYAMRGKTHPPHVGLEEGIERIARATRLPVVVADTSDGPGAGAPGDATFVLRAFLDRGIAPAAFGYLWDPVMVSVAFNAGVGALLPMRIGGKMGPCSGWPIDLEVEVRSLHPDSTVPMEQGVASIGDVAVVRARGIDIALTRDRPVAMSSGHFTSLGVDPGAVRALVVKSVNNFRAGFESIAGEFVYLASPGALGTDLRTHPYRRIQRPKWPLDQEPP